jgi:hypothetical protein
VEGIEERWLLLFCFSQIMKSQRIILNHARSDRTTCFEKGKVRLCVLLTGAESHRELSSRFPRRARAIGQSTVSFCKSHNQCEDAKKKKEDLEANVISANPKPYVLSRSDLISCRGRQENPKASTCVFPSTGRTMTVDGICFGGLYNKWEAGEEKEEDLTVNFIPTLQSPCSLLPCSLRRARNMDSL